MTAAAIARWAGVGRAAVSNWQRRYANFPKPVGGTASSPTFSRQEVEAWLAATGKRDQLATAGRTDTGTHRIDEPADRDATDLTPGELLARAVVGLLPTPMGSIGGEAPVVLDPACADGAALMAVVDRFGDRVRVVGQERDESAAAAAEVNLQNRPHEIYVGDSLRDDKLSMYLEAAAAVVCEPPLNEPLWPYAELATDPRWTFGTPGPRDAELAWVQHCYAHLRPRGVAVIVVSQRTCVQPSGKSVRAALVRSGVLRDVIALPIGLGSAPETELCLWVLQRPHGAFQPGPVRMVDLTSVGDPAEVPMDCTGWQQIFEDTTASRAMDRLELLDDDTALLPARHVREPVGAGADDLARVTERLQGLYTQVGRGLPHFAEPKTPIRHTWVTLAELERVGALAIRSRETTPRAGDVLMQTMGRPPAVANGSETSNLGVALILELDSTRLDAHFVATFLRREAAAVPMSNTVGALSRDDLRRCRIPRLALAQQRSYGDTFRQLRELQGALSALAAASTTVIDQTVHSLTAGTVAPRPTKQMNLDSSTEGETREL